METQDFMRIAQELDHERLERAEDAVYELLGAALVRDSIDPSEYEPRRELIVAALESLRETGYGSGAPEHMGQLVERVIDEGADRDRALRFLRFLAERGVDGAGQQVVEEVDRQIRAGRFNRKCLKAALKFLAVALGTAAACASQTVLGCVAGSVAAIDLGLDAADACGFLDATTT